MRIPFSTDQRGNVALILAILLFPIMMAVGSSLDYARVARSHTSLQSTADAAVLAVAGKYNETRSLTGLSAIAENFLSTNIDYAFKPGVKTPPALTTDNDQICVGYYDNVPSTFLSTIGLKSIYTSASACAALVAVNNIEISIVVDVSSSMVENSRFSPMVEAVKAFVSKFSSDAVLNKRTKIAIVPFSSRINIGLGNQDWLTTFNGSAAVPDRWKKPTATYHSSTFSELTWVDKVTTGYYNGKNYYWLGCVEPRSDVDVNVGGKVSSASLTASAPASAKFVAMDHNTKSAKSFCPPPIVGLTSDFSLLQSAASALTSQGSTRLDAGILAGWYTLSPSWRGLWTDKTAPLDSNTSTQKIIVFMTDGQMNTQYGSDSSKMDWLCLKNKNSTCNDLAEGHLSTICSAIKASDISIYTVAYDEDSNATALSGCATSKDLSFSATRFKTSSSYITTIYDAIAEDIRDAVLRISS